MMKKLFTLLLVFLLLGLPSMVQAQPTVEPQEHSPIHYYCEVEMPEMRTYNSSLTQWIDRVSATLTLNGQISRGDGDIIATFISIYEPAIDEWFAIGILHKGYRGGAWLYCDYKREGEPITRIIFGAYEGRSYRFEITCLNNQHCIGYIDGVDMAEWDFSNVGGFTTERYWHVQSESSYMYSQMNSLAFYLRCGYWYITPVGWHYVESQFWTPYTWHVDFPYTMTLYYEPYPLLEGVWFHGGLDPNNRGGGGGVCYWL